MDVKIEMANDVVILAPVGNLVASTTEFFKSQVGKLLEKRFTRILLDMSKVDFMDSSGLGACIAVNKSITDQGGIMVCSDQNDAVAKVFKVTHANKRIHVVGDRREGLARMLELASAAGATP